MSKVALFFNSPYLGGAERSGVYQAKLLGERVDFFVPHLAKKNSDESWQLSNLLQEPKVTYYHYPAGLFGVSRFARGIFSFIFSLTILCQLLGLLWSWKKLNLHQYDYLWFNGNKVGVVGFLFAHLFSFKGKVVWHFRDYPHKKSFFRFIWPLLGLPRGFEFILVGNSQSVTQMLKDVTKGKVPVQTVYNPVGLASPGNTEIHSKTIRRIGVVSMMAPWKGIHQIILMASLYEKELLALGLEEIKIYGAPIYKTKGPHSNYLDQLRGLMDKFPCSLVKLCGQKKPEEIYGEIDLLIHSSIDPEPFGRVLTEAFVANVLVFSTAAGGAAELVEDGVTGVRFSNFDYQGIYQKLQFIMLHPSYAAQLRQGGMALANEIEKLAHDQLYKIFAK